MNKLQQAYNDPSNPVSFSGPERLLRYARQKVDKKITRSEIDDFLSRQESYTRFKRKRGNFERLKILVTAPRKILSIDLADFQRISEFNDGYRYVLVAIDTFSRFAWAYPLRTKRGVEVSQRLEEIIRQTNYPKIHCDEGTEFYNSHVQGMLKKYNSSLYSTYGKGKAAHAERLIRTLKGRLFRLLHQRNTWQWIDFLPLVVRAYNNTKHSAFKEKYTPIQVHNGQDVAKIRELLYGTPQAVAAPRKVYKVGDYVRLSQSRFTFAKGYYPQNTEEIFQIARVHRNDPISYHLKDLGGEAVKERVYNGDLIRVTRPKTYRITVLKSRGKRHFVHWQGWPSKFDEWIKADQIVT